MDWIGTECEESVEWRLYEKGEEERAKERDGGERIEIERERDERIERERERERERIERAREREG